MSLLDDFKDDIAEIMDTDEFAKRAIFNGVSAIDVLFEEDAVLLDVAGEVIGSSPQATVLSSEISSPFGKTLEVNSIVYKIIEVRPNSSGMTVLTLSKD